MLSHILRPYFPGHRFSDNQGKIVDELSTKDHDSNNELQAFNSVLLRDPPKEKKDPRKRGAPNVPELLKRTCLPDVARESTPPRPPEICAPIWEWLRQNGEISGAPNKMVRELPPVLKPSALALELMNDKNYKFIMGMSIEDGRKK